MKTLQFVTGNPRKFESTSRAIADRLPTVSLRRLDVDLPEIQTDDVVALLTDKAAHARALTALPFIVDDASAVIQGTKNFPGALIKNVLNGLGTAVLPRVFAEGLRIEVSCTIALSYLDELHLFTGTVMGTIRHGRPMASGLPLNSFVYLDDQKKFLGDPGAVTHRTKAIDALCAFLSEQDAHDGKEQTDTAGRWSSRAAAWDKTVQDASSYVNHEDGYARFDRLLAKIMKTVERPTCLDVGCGTGAVAKNMLAGGAASVLGIDVSEGMIAAATAAVPPSAAGPSFRVAELSALPDGSAFDVIASRGVVLSHLPKHRVIEHLAALTKISRPGSYAVFDFIQDLANGGFADCGPKNSFAYGQIVRLMRELGWVPAAKDGAGRSRVVVAAFHRPHEDSLYFVSGNPQKILELRQAADRPHLHGCDFDLPEMKCDDIVRIAEAKARLAYDLVGRPVISTDGGIFLDAFGGFPGPNSKQAATLLKPEGILKLLAGAAVRTGRRRNAVAWFDGQTMRTGVDEVPITIADAPRGTYPSYPLDRILVPLDPKNGGSRTYAEMPPEERVPFTELPGLAAFVETCR